MNCLELGLPRLGEPSVEADDEGLDVWPLARTPGAVHDSHADLEHHEVAVGREIC